MRLKLMGVIFEECSENCRPNVGQYTQRCPHITLEEQQSEIDQELHETQRALKVASCTVVEAQHLTLSKAGEARQCLQKLKGVMEQLGLARERVTSFEAESAEAIVWSKGALARMQEDLDLTWHHTAAAESSLTGVHKEIAVVTAKDSNLESPNAKAAKEIGNIFFDTC